MCFSNVNIFFRLDSIGLSMYVISRVFKNQCCVLQSLDVYLLHPLNVRARLQQNGRYTQYLGMPDITHIVYTIIHYSNTIIFPYCLEVLALQELFIWVLKIKISEQNFLKSQNDVFLQLIRTYSLFSCYSGKPHAQA